MAPWKPDLPGDCPPRESYPPTGRLFRVARKNPPTSEDFESMYVRSPNLAMTRVRAGSCTLCEAMGLSAYLSESDALRCAQHYRKLGEFVAAVEPPAEKCCIANTGRLSHVTLWLHADIDATQYVTAVVAAT